MTDENKKVEKQVASKQLGDVFKKKEKAPSYSRYDGYGSRDSYGGYGGYGYDSYGYDSYRSTGRDYSRRRTPRRYTYTDMDDDAYDPLTGEVFHEDSVDDLYRETERQPEEYELGRGHEGSLMDQFARRVGGGLAEVTRSEWMRIQDKIYANLLNDLEKHGLIVRNEGYALVLRRAMMRELGAYNFYYRDGDKDREIRVTSNALGGRFE